MPKELPMWQVDKIGYLTSKTARIGLVSRGERFEEGPDAEYISSGVCQKDVGAVALGRHGNFFLWGFGASPAEMTEEGKKVFVNAVAYMAQFDGRTPIARKYNDRMATTDDIIELAGRTTRENYDNYVKSLTSFNEANAATKKRLEAKQANGDTLSEEEKVQLQYAGYTQEINTWEQYLRQNMGKWYDQFGTDNLGFIQFLQDNLDYVYCDPNAFFSWHIDEDVKKIGISNHDVRLLDTCVQMLNNGTDQDLAQRVLERYTHKKFANAQEWQQWLNTHRSKLFFTETDGYRFMVDTYTK